MLKTSLNPDLYHGSEKKNNFFEGWYYKLVHPTGRLTYAIIPGILLADASENSHSFIQFLDGSATNFEYIRFSADSFSAHPSKFDISIDKNNFTRTGIDIHLNHAGISVSGNLQFSNIFNWPDSILNPGSMGFYNYLSFMQCYSQVCCMSCDINGSLRINDKLIDFTGGKAYIEKNWGRAFPYSYIWAQCNTFTNNELSLSCSIGHIPFPLGSFNGFLIGFYFKGIFYKFTTINRSKLRMSVTDNSINIEVLNKTHCLSFCVYCNKSGFMDLYAPRENNMVPIARECLQGKIEIRLSNLKSGEVLVEDIGYAAGMEFSGDYRSLAKNFS